jgi:tungstate transport system substrate-binding protein
MRRWLIGLLLPVLLLCATTAGAESTRFILMASTIGPIDSGIVDALELAFEKESGIRVRHVGAGTGAALEMAKKGGFDLVLVHAKSLEEQFVKEGFGTERIDFMYNDFVILGPAKDPAAIKGMKSASQALRQISERMAPFITRGDKSGTHISEMLLWEKAGIKPAGTWYITYERGAEGNVSTLKYTDSKEAYTVMDRATFLSMKDVIGLKVLVEGDEALLNYISLIPVNPTKVARVNQDDTMTYVKWLTAPGKGQRIVETFGSDKYGSPLFFPNSAEWRKAKKGIGK